MVEELKEKGLTLKITNTSPRLALVSVELELTGLTEETQWYALLLGVRHLKPEEAAGSSPVTITGADFERLRQEKKK